MLNYMEELVGCTSKLTRLMYYVLLLTCNGISIFVGIMKGQLQDIMTNAIKENVNNLNEQIAKQLATMQYLVPITSVANVNLDITLEQVLFNQNIPPSIMLGAKGAVQDSAAAPYPGPAAPSVTMPLNIPGENMVQLAITDYVFNTAGYAFYQSGVLQKSISDKDIPSKVPFHLNTATFKAVAPGLYAKYPDTPVQIVFTAVGTDPTLAPQVNITAIGGATVTLNGDANFQVLVNDTAIDAFQLSTVFIFDGKFGIQGNNIVGALQFDQLTLTLISSQVGDINAQALNTFVGSIVHYVVLPVVNGMLATGFPVPSMDGITLVNPTVVFQDRFIGVASNFTFTPNSQIWRVNK
jgi:hypothetical protein